MVPAKCHPDRKHRGRGLCGTCYQREYFDRNPEAQAKAVARQKRWREDNPERLALMVKRRRAKDRNDPVAVRKKKNQMLQRKYGITMDDFDRMHAAQDGRCAICLYPPAGAKSLHVDHCHVSGKVRGLLCAECNWYLGTVDSDPQVIDRMILYRSVG